MRLVIAIFTIFVFFFVFRFPLTYLNHYVLNLNPLECTCRKRPASPTLQDTNGETQKNGTESPPRSPKRQKVSADETVTAFKAETTETLLSVSSSEPAVPSEVSPPKAPHSTPVITPNKTTSSTPTASSTAAVPKKTERDASITAPAIRSTRGGSGGPSLGLPMLRSSPIVPQGESRSGQVGATGEAGKRTGADGKESAEAAARRERKKNKKVSWAKDEGLVEMHFIDTRIQLVQSWDPDYQVTLPFAPATLQMIQSVLKTREDGAVTAESSGPNVFVEANASTSAAAEDGGNGNAFAGGAALPMISSFEEARKKEYNMELERARQTREELKSRLNAICEIRRWNCPSTLVMPAECLIDETHRAKYAVVDGDYDGNRSAGGVSRNGGSVETPGSPPSEQWGWANDGEVSDLHVRAFPLSDGDVREGDGDAIEEDGGGQWNNGGSNRMNDNRDAGYFGGMHRPAGGNMGGAGLRSHVGHGMSGRDISKVGLRNAEGPGRRNGGLRDKGGARMNFTPNVRQLLTALASSGLLKGKVGDGAVGQQHGGGDVSGSEDVMGEQDGFAVDDGVANGQGLADEMNGGGGRNMGGAGNAPGIGFSGGLGQGNVMDCLPFGIPPVPPGAMGLAPNMMPMGLGLPLPMGMPLLPMGIPGGGMGMNGPGVGVGGNGDGGGVGGVGGGRGLKGGRNGRHVETITRPKSKGQKQRKKCKYFGTKQGCRDGASCMFAHN